MAGIAGRQCPRVTPELVDEWVRLYESGLSLSKIAAATTGAAETTIRRHLLQRRVDTSTPQGGRKPVVSDDATLQEIKRLYLEEGLSLEQIGARFGLSRTSIANYLAKAGVERRDRKRAARRHPEEVYQQILDAYFNGESMYSVAKRLHVTETLITKFLQREGIKVKPQVGTTRLEYAKEITAEFNTDELQELQQHINQLLENN